MPSSLVRIAFVWPVLIASVCAAEPATPPETKNAYPLEAYAAIGSSLAQSSQLVQFGWTEAQFDAFVDGMRAAFRGKPYAVNAPAQALQEEIGRHLQQLESDEARTHMAQLTDPKRLEAYMKDAVKNFHLQRSDSGLAYGIMPQRGARPGPDDTVIISCEVVAADAKTELPQLSVKQKRIKVADLIPGLIEGIQLMNAKGSAMFIVPPDLSYGDGEWPAGVVKGTPLIYTVLLEEIVPAP